MLRGGSPGRIGGLLRALERLLAATSCGRFQGVVGTVEMAMLSSKKPVELEVDRRATPVSNLMMVLCSERDAQPVVNADALPQ